MARNAAFHAMSGLVAMSDTLNLNVRLKGTLRDHVTRELDTGTYDNVSEYVRALIRCEHAQAQQKSFEILRDELQAAFVEPESEYVELTADDVFKLNAHVKRR